MADPGAAPRPVEPWPVEPPPEGPLSREGRALLDDDRPEEAVDPLRRAVAAGEPGAPDLLARAYLDSGDWPGCIEWLGPYVEQGHVEFAGRLGVAYAQLGDVDNAEEALRLSGLLGGREAQRVLLRVTPGVDADTHEAILTGQAGSKFGFAPADARALIADPPAGLRIDGLHMHLGSQLFALEPYRRAIGALGTLGVFGTYDLGGGLGVPYVAGDPQLDVETWVAGMVEAAHAELGGDVELVLEPGRALVANAGVTLYAVESVKDGAAGELLVAVDGGMSDNLRPMLYGAGYEAHVVTRMGSGGVASTVVGKHCESGDVLVRDAELPDPRPGDVVVTPATGAYGYALANNYNGQPRPPVVFCSGGRSRVVVRRETYEELHGRDV